VRLRLLALLSAATVSAADSDPRDQCATPGNAELDFVIGNWLVRDSVGRAVGTVTVAKAYGGRVLIETWIGAGRAGQSLGVIGYQPDRKRWRRDFLDADGTAVTLEGGLEGAAMVMTGKDYPADGVRLHRVAWRPRQDGAVEERWQTSTDDGHSWQTRSSGVLHRIAE
jgi:hypothetical protein